MGFKGIWLGCFLSSAARHPCQGLLQSHSLLLDDMGVLSTVRGRVQGRRRMARVGSLSVSLARSLAEHVSSAASSTSRKATTEREGRE